MGKTQSKGTYDVPKQTSVRRSRTFKAQENPRYHKAKEEILKHIHSSSSLAHQNYEDDLTTATPSTISEEEREVVEFSVGGGTIEPATQEDVKRLVGEACQGRRRSSHTLVGSNSIPREEVELKIKHAIEEAIGVKVKGNTISNKDEEETREKGTNSEEGLLECLRFQSRSSGVIPEQSVAEEEESLPISEIACETTDVQDADLSVQNTSQDQHEIATHGEYASCNKNACEKGTNSEEGLLECLRFQSRSSVVIPKQSVAEEEESLPISEVNETADVHDTEVSVQQIPNTLQHPHEVTTQKEYAFCNEKACVIPVLEDQTKADDQICVAESPVPQTEENQELRVEENSNVQELHKVDEDDGEKVRDPCVQQSTPPKDLKTTAQNNDESEVLEPVINSTLSDDLPDDNPEKVCENLDHVIQETILQQTVDQENADEPKTNEKGVFSHEFASEQIVEDTDPNVEKTEQEQTRIICNKADSGIKESISQPQEANQDQATLEPVPHSQIEEGLDPNETETRSVGTEQEQSRIICNTADSGIKESISLPQEANQEQATLEPVPHSQNEEGPNPNDTETRSVGVGIQQDRAKFLQNILDETADHTQETQPASIPAPEPNCAESKVSHDERIFEVGLCTHDLQNPICPERTCNSSRDVEVLLDEAVCEGEELKKRIEVFQGSSEEWHDLEQVLVLKIRKLNELDTGNKSDDVRNKLKNTVGFLQECLDLLKKKKSQNMDHFRTS